MPGVSTTASSPWRARASADNKDRWLVALDPETGKTRVVDTLHDDAWVREAGGFGWLRRRVPARQQARLVPLGARRLDAPLHARRRRRGDAEAEAADDGQVGDRVGRPRARREEVLRHHHRGASRRAAPLHGAARRRRADEDHVDDRLERRRRLARRVDARPGLLLQHQAARSVPDAEHAGREGDSRSRRRRPRSGARSTGSIRRSSRSRRATASTSTRGCSRRR